MNGLVVACFDADIVMLVNDHNDDDTQREEEEEEHEEEARKVTAAEALKNVHTAMQCFEQLTQTEADMIENSSQITKLLVVVRSCA